MKQITYCRCVGRGAENPVVRCRYASLIIIAGTLSGLISGQALAQRVPELYPQFGDAKLDGASGSVAEILTFDDGTGPALVAGGSFVSAGLSRASNIAKLTPSGQWMPMGEGLPAPVRALAVFNDGTGLKLYAGGTFGATNEAGTGVRRWNGSSWEEVGNGPDGPVADLVVWNDGFSSQLYACGSFSTSNGVSTPRVARWNGLTWSAVGSGPGSIVSGTANALSAWDSPTGAMLALGGFITINGVAGVVPVAVWNGSAWTRISSITTNSPVTTLGQFQKPGVRELWFASADFSNPLRKWNGLTVSNISGISSFGTPQIRLLKQARENNEDVMLVGGIVNLSGGLNGVLKHNGNTATSIVTGNGAVFGEVSSAAYFSLAADAPGTSRLIVGGNFSTVFAPTGGGSVYTGPVAATRTDRTGFSAFTSTLTTPGVRAIGYVGNGPNISILAGGFFSRAFVHTSMPFYLARFDGASWVGTPTGVNGGVESIVRLADGSVLLGGNFTSTFTTPQQQLNSLARFDGNNITSVPRSGGTSVGVETPVSCMVRAQEPSGESVYIALTSSLSTLRRYSGGATEVVPNVNNAIIYALDYALSSAHPDAALYAAGSIVTIGGGASRLVARLTPQGMVAVGPANISGIAQALHIVRSELTSGPDYALPSGMVLVGGTFNVTGANNVVTQASVVYNAGSEWKSLGDNLSGGVNELFVLGGSLYAGGTLTVLPQAGYPERASGRGLARWVGDGWELVTNVSNQPGFSGSMHAYAIDPNNPNAAIIGGHFDRVDGVDGFDAYGAAGLIARLACAEDFNEDGGVDGLDVSDFFAQWSESGPDADVNHDGGVDGEDVTFFFERWTAGGC
jgi:hypothetical protein